MQCPCVRFFYIFLTYSCVQRSTREDHCHLSSSHFPVSIAISPPINSQLIIHFISIYHCVHPSVYLSTNAQSTKGKLFLLQVVYTAEGFVTKNSDTLPHNLREVVQRSDNSFIQNYFIMGSDAVAALHKYVDGEMTDAGCLLLLLLMLFLVFFHFCNRSSSSSSSCCSSNSSSSCSSSSSSSSCSSTSFFSYFLFFFCSSFFSFFLLSLLLIVLLLLISLAPILQNLEMILWETTCSRKLVQR